ncbi:MAG: heavy-metal-associated domain-containing protein [Chloroflexi bacterium]|nr:heavy-metal-associated domain-containing protein [Chloroflexota bacterium]
MKVLTLELPAMYGDHHVVEVKRLLMALDGVADVYASSAFQAAEVSYDPKKVSEEDIETELEKNGYLGSLFISEETGIAVNVGESKADTFYRHTEAYAQTGKVVSFGQDIAQSSRGLWPCPGMSPAKMDEE